MHSHPEAHCVFCQIVNQQAPAFTFWENEHHVAFLSIYPNTAGVSVVIPKHHYPSDCFTLPQDALLGLVLAAQSVSQILCRLPGVGRTAMVMEGFGVDHAHAKLFPMHGTEMETWKPIRSKLSKIFQTYPGYISSHDAPQEFDFVLEKMRTQLIELSQQR